MTPIAVRRCRTDRVREHLALAARFARKPNGGARRRPTRFALALAPALALGLLGCATKADVRVLQRDIDALRLRQDSLFRENQRQTRMLLDTVRTAFAIQQDVRGETSHRFVQLEQNLSRLEEMINQTQLLIGQLMDRLDRQPSVSVPGAGVDARGTPSPGEVESLYATGLQKKSEGAYTTARAAFEAIVQQYADDARAPDAQFQLAETYYLEEQHDRAIEELQKVERQWPRSERAPDALLRAGIIAQETNQPTKARELFTQVRQRYPQAEAAREAERRLRAIRR